MNNEEVLEKIYDLCVLSGSEGDAQKNVRKIKELIESSCDLKVKKLEVFYPVLDHTESVAFIGVQRHYFTHHKNIEIPDAFSAKNKGLMLVIDNLDLDKHSIVTVKAGNTYPNSMLGDLVIELNQGISVIQLADLARFERNGGSLCLEFPEDMRGSIYAIGDWRAAKAYLDKRVDN